MAIAKLKLFNLSSDTADMDKVLSRFADLTWLHPILATQVTDRVHDLVPVEMDNPYAKLLDELKTIEKDFEIKIKEEKVEKASSELKVLKKYVSETHTELNKYLQQKKDALGLIKKYQEALIQVTNIENLDISLDDVFSSQYINVRVGILPVDSVEKLALYEFKPFIFKSFNIEDGNCWCIYFCTEDYKVDIDNIFKTLFFRRIHIPDFVHGTPKDAEINLMSELDFANENLKEIQEQIDKIVVKNVEKLNQAKTDLIHLSKIYEAKKFVVTSGDKISLTGFVEDKKTQKLNDVFDDIEGVKIQFRPPDSDKRLSPPTLLKNSWFTKPFAMLVDMYGVPGYRDIDPTAMVAITYSLLFGIMFGDLGQGLLLSLFGFILFKWKGWKLAKIATRIGISSAFFGLIYGSFFGDHVFLPDHLYRFYKLFGTYINGPLDPMQRNLTMYFLGVTLALGSLLIISSMTMNIITNFRKRNIGEALFSENGIAGVIFYIFLIGGVALTFIFNIPIYNIYTILLLGVIPLLLITFNKPLSLRLMRKRMFPDGFSGFMIDGVVGLVEILLNYVTNTLSFLRVGGFVMAHVGMMAVVFTIQAMTNTTFGSYTVFVLGNLFVMAVEGLLVGIQVLRLEFYEMFSRYFEGDGTPFKPYM